MTEIAHQAAEELRRRASRRSPAVQRLEETNAEFRAGVDASLGRIPELRREAEAARANADEESVFSAPPSEWGNSPRRGGSPADTDEENSFEIVPPDSTRDMAASHGARVAAEPIVGVRSEAERTFEAERLWREAKRREREDRDRLHRLELLEQEVRHELALRVLEMAKLDRRMSILARFRWSGPLGAIMVVLGVALIGVSSFTDGLRSFLLVGTLLFGAFLLRANFLILGLELRSKKSADAELREHESGADSG